MEARAPIRTPDQRIRVFVSSTLKELEPERRAARAAIERLHLAPVMFELGARPHPPRSLYRSYLEQSDIFVGLYWERYGWVAPDEEVSGLEDEYRLSGGRPSLIYIKEPAPRREERLDALLADIRGDDRTSYKSFRTPEELEQLLVADLATLLADRFDAAENRPSDHRLPTPSRYPAPYTDIIGREREVADILSLLRRPDVRMVTLLGPGGIGKSRLAIEVGRAVADDGGDVGFVLLESLTSPDQLLPAIARSVGVRDTGDVPLESAVLAAFADRDYLLIVDNMEHLLDAAGVLVDLLTRSPRLTVLVTSRSPLRVRAEHTFEVRPLEVPETGDPPDAAVSASSVRLFAERAAAVRPGFRLTTENTAAVVAICRALDGVPLAIELAAARVRSYTPDQLLARLGSALSVLVDGARDLPSRQRTIRSTIEWSARLLDEDARDALAVLSVFAGPFSRDAAEEVLRAASGAPADTADLDVERAIDALVDASLLQLRDRGGVQLFALLALVRAYGADQLSPERADAARERWIAHYTELGAASAVGVRGPDELRWLATLDAQAENIVAVMRHLLDARRFDEAAELAWSLYMTLWLHGYLGVVQAWMSGLLDIRDREEIRLTAHAEAVALYYANAISFWQNPDVDVTPGLRRAVSLFEQCGDAAAAALTRVSLGLAMLARAEGPDVAGATTAVEAAVEGYRSVGDAWGQAMALVTRGRLDLVLGAVDAARDRFERSLAHARSQHERLAVVIAQHHRGWARLLQGEVEDAEADFSEGLDASIAMAHDEGIAYGLEGLGGVAAVRGRAETAGMLLGAAGRLRRRTGIVNLAQFALYGPAVAALRDSGGGEAFDAAAERANEMTVAEVLDAVRD
jgi:predicted ATPase